MIHRYRLRGIATVILSSLVTITLYILSKSSSFNWFDSPLKNISQILALLGTIYLSLTFILSSRIKVIESLFGGLDIVYKLHHILGAIGFVFLLHHPLLLAIQQISNRTLALRFLLPSGTISYDAGIYALFLMILLMILTLFVNLPYHIWKATHTWMGGSLFLSMIHVFLIGSDISRYFPLKIWMMFWMSSAGLSYLMKRFAYRWYADSVQYVVSSVKINQSIIALTLKPKEEKNISFIPGQFVFLSVNNNSAIGYESHPFSIASAPDDGEIVLYCKKTGDYVDRLTLLKKDELVTLNGPYGTFMEKVPVAKKIVGIAGGIGITPFLSLLKSIKNNPNVYTDFSLFHAVKIPEESLVFSEEGLPNNVSITIHASKQQGRLKVEKIIEQTPDWKQATFFLCGPISMMTNLRSELLNKGVRPSKIIFEDFSFK